MASRTGTANTSRDLTAAPASQGELEHLRRLVRRGRRRWALLTLLEAAGLCVAVPLAYLWLVFLLDNLLHFNRAGRLLASGLFATVVVVLLARLWSNWRRARFTEDQVALAIERRTHAALDNRLINAIQLSRSGPQADPDMSRAVVAENYRHLVETQLEQAAASRPAILRLTAAAALILVGVCYGILGGEKFSNAAGRIFLPLAELDPIYQTRLSVAPGDVTVAAGADVPLTISIAGAVPAELVVLIQRGSDRQSQPIEVTAGQRTARFTIKSVGQSMSYAVQGGDFTSRVFSINVPIALALNRVSTVYHFPPYTQLPDRMVESASGDLEALRGTRASLAFAFNAPVEQARLILDEQTAGASAASAQHVERSTRTLSEIAGGKFGGQIVFQRPATYRLECRYQGRDVQTPSYGVAVTSDAAPTPELSLVEPGAQVMVDAVLPLSLSARDDYGLTKLGLFYRHVHPDGAKAAGPWVELQTWAPQSAARDWNSAFSLPVAMLEAAEGDQVELALKARDNDPDKHDWTTGTRVPLAVSGAGADLQITYERILRSESGLARLMAGHEQLSQQASKWLSQLGSPGRGPASDASRTALVKAMHDQIAAQRRLRNDAVGVAREMVEQTGSLRLSVGMLADTEMVRDVRILETVAQQDTPQAMRTALADAQLTQQRTLRSLQEVLEEHARFRADWELSHMLAFTKMLAQRQSGMADASLTYAGLQPTAVGERLRRSVGRRQAKLLELSQLAQTAFRGMQKRTDEVGATVAAAFGAAARAFDTSGLKKRMGEAVRWIGQGGWNRAEPDQRQAAQRLSEIYGAVHAAQLAAAQQALDKLKDLAAKSVEAQQELQKLEPGSRDNLVNFDPAKFKLDELIRMRKVADDLERRRDRPGDKLFEHRFDERMKAMFSPTLVPGKGQDFSTLTLANKPSGQMSMPDYSGREPNSVTAAIQEKVEDLVGKLLDEADDLRDQYETYNINAAFQTNEPGDVGKQGGALNSTAASAATGNMKPPTQNFGGASRTGRQGARAHGLVVGDKAINRRGRDKVQEGQEDVANQAGMLKQTDSEDPQLDASTGRGGKKTDAKQTQYSTANAGKWEEKDIDQLQPPQQQFNIVERKGAPLDPKLADMMRDLGSNQEQVLERVKALKKELDQLYLPTDHLQDIMAQLAKNLDRLRDKPAPEIFRQQAELLEKLQSTVIVFNRPSAQFEQALPRKQAIGGMILDEPAVQPVPGYEEAVSHYYEKLSAP